MNTITISSFKKGARLPDGNPFKFYVLDDIKIYGSESTVIPVGFTFDLSNSHTLIVDSLRPDLIVVDYVKLADEIGIVVQAVEYVQVELNKDEPFAVGRVVETPLAKLRFVVFNEDSKRTIFGGVSKVENSNSETDK